MDGKSVNLFTIINVICFVRDFKYNDFFFFFCILACQLCFSCYGFMM